MFVLDEADKMFEMGFIEDIERIAKFLPDVRQNLFFSATMTDEVLRIKNKFTRNAKKVKTETMLNEDVLEQFYYDVYPAEKFSLLIHLLKSENPDLSIIFCNTRREAGCVAENLKRNDIIASCLHGGLTQARRNQVIQDFHDRRIKVLVATDVAGRGLDIKNVSHIFNYSIPKCPEDYINRVGRTARAGETGKAISLLANNDHDCFRKLISMYSQEIKRVDKPDFEVLPFRKDFDSERRPFYRRDFGHGLRRNGFRPRYSRY
jgi:ATP-dependent RNA helicase DeaD